MNKRTTKFYRKNEAEVMNDLGLRPTKNSGAGWIEKEDGQSDHIIAQLKSTDKMSIGVSLKDINMLEYNAGIAHKIPIFVLQFLQTNDIFVMVRPVDLPGLNELIETGTTTIVQSVDIAPDELTRDQAIAQLEAKYAETGHTLPPQIKSGDRSAFWAEKEKERAKWQKRK